MVYNFNGVKVNFKVFEARGDEANKTPLLLLHGWGCDSRIFENFISLIPNRKIIVLDFPPFGESNVEPNGWNVFTYANMVLGLCQHLNIKKVDVLGHSFGGRVAIILTSLRSDFINKCILVDSAGLKPRHGLKYYAKLYYYKLARYFGFMFSRAGSADYQALSYEMKKVFVSIVNQHLDDYLPLIKKKTLIIFGENDKETPVYMAHRLHKNVENSRLEIIKGGGHFCFLDNLLTFYRLVDEFLEE